jgi:Trk-type K+ transport system membrane component
VLLLLLLLLLRVLQSLCRSLLVRSAAGCCCCASADALCWGCADLWQPIKFCMLLLFLLLALLLLIILLLLCEAFQLLWAVRGEVARCFALVSFAGGCRRVPAVFCAGLMQELVCRW